MHIKKTPLLSIIIALLITNTLVSNPVFAITKVMPSNVYSDFSEDLTEEIEEKLSDEEIILEKVEGNEDEISLEATYETNDEEEITIDVDLNLEDATVELSTWDEEGNLDEYEITINYLDSGRIVFTYVDPETGDEHTYNSTKATALIAPAIPLGIAISASLFSALAKTAAVIVVAGAAYIVASEAIPKVNKNKKKKQYNHFAAVISKSNGKLYIGKGLSTSAAITRAKKSQDVWSVSKTQAKAVAKGANPHGTPFHEIDKDKKGKYYHWHPYRKKPNMHSFYGKAQ
ncbi:MAG TPA: SAR2788 family putative toxin [Pseudogracilibacillus sp.]|nr:SAR2788 family putative toxin [Pseudogracilibacillus sp.]